MKWTDIPIIINAKDRKSCLEILLQRLEQDGLMSQVLVLDTGSTYPPMLEYLKSLKCRVIYFYPQGNPSQAVWELGCKPEWAEYTGKSEGWFVYTDCDVVPDGPSNWMECFFEALKCHSAYSKVGFGLRIDNLPDCCQLKDKVLAWESQFWTHALNSAWFVAPIDTTLALYKTPAPRPPSPALRSNHPYVAKHLPWYYDSKNPTEEYVYYLRHMYPLGHWSSWERTKILS